MEFDLDKALEDVPIHVEDPVPLLKLDKKPSGTGGDLPSEEAKKLLHYTKLRPKRNKKINSSRVPVSQFLFLSHVTSFFIRCAFQSLFIRMLFHIRLQQVNNVPSENGEQNGLIGRVDEGMDDFFSKKVIKIDKSVT